MLCPSERYPRDEVSSPPEWTAPGRRLASRPRRLLWGRDRAPVTPRSRALFAMRATRGDSGLMDQKHKLHPWPFMHLRMRPQPVPAVRFEGISLSSGVLSWRYSYYIRREPISGATAVIEVFSTSPRIYLLSIANESFTVAVRFPGRQLRKAERFVREISHQSSNNTPH